MSKPYRRSRHPLVLLVLLLPALLLASACGSRLSDSERAEAIANASGSGGTGTSGTGSGTSGSAATGGAGSTGQAATPGATPGDPATSGGGTGGGSVDPGAGGGGGGGGAACAPSEGSTDPGLSSGEIKLGNVSTITGPVPGFGATGVGATKAYLEYRNSTGGVCGRKLSLETADDRLDPGANRSETERLARSVFAFVGNTTVVDGAGAAIIDAQGIPDCSLAIGAERLASPNNFSPNPIDPNVNSNGTVSIWNWMKANKGITKVAVVYPAQADARTRGQAYIPDIQAAGLAVSGPYEVAITETNYVGVASKIRDDGADAVMTTLEVNGMAKLAQSFDQIGYKPKVPFYGAQAYGPQFLKLAGSAAEGTVLGLTYAIFEDAGANPAVATFLEWFRRVNPGLEPDFFAIMSWAATDMCVKAIEAAGGAPTRAATIEALRTFNSFDAGGMLAPRDPPNKKIGDQFMVAEVQGGQWVRTFPGQGFAAG